MTTVHKLVSEPAAKEAQPFDVNLTISNRLRDDSHPRAHARRGGSAAVADLCERSCKARGCAGEGLRRRRADCIGCEPLSRAGRPRRRRSQSLREPVMESRRPRAVCPALLIWSAPWLPSTFRASKSCGSSLVAFFASLQRPGASALFKNASSVTGARPSNLLS
jgi:hypothetical protein